MTLSTLEHPRFQLLEPLGEGGMGTVFRALDRERGSVVALKVLTHVTPLGIHRFKHEFRALADVSHPNLLTLYELLSTGSHWFFTAELIEGTDLVTHLRGALGQTEQAELAAATRLLARATGTRARTDPACTYTPTLATVTSRFVHAQPARSSIAAAGRSGTHAPIVDADALAVLRDTFTQLAVGLNALHRAGHLHRDVKPSNVLVTPEGRVVLLDFGVLATFADEDPFERHIVGTPAYMAPEQALGDALDERSDWYAVGTMLFELLVGRRPFIGSSEEVISLRTKIDARPVRVLEPRAPVDLAALADALLARSPAERPSGEEVLAQLGVARTAAARVPSIVGVEVGPLIGRAQELAVLEAVTAQVRGGPASRTMVVQGASGMGKTALCEAFLARARGKGAVVVAGRCHERELVPFKAADALVDSLARKLAALPEARRHGLGRALGTLAVPFPVLAAAEVDPLRSIPTGPLDPGERKRLIAPALRELLLGVAGDATLLLCIDDAQWGDADSAALLAETLAPPWPGRLVLVLACRSEDGPSDFLRLLSRGLVIDVTLDIGPLPALDAAAMARRFLSVGSGGEVESPCDPRAERLAREARGIPFYLVELAQREHDTPAGDRAAPAPAGGERAALDSLLQQRIDGLPEEGRRLLEALAVAARPLLAQVAAQAAGLPTADQSLLVLLRNRRLVRARRVPRGEVLEAFHDQIRELVCETLDAGATAAVHRRLAAALEAHGGDAEALATHHEGAGDREQAFVWARRAAEEAAGALAFDRAAGWYERALALGVGDPEVERALTVSWGHALAHAGRSAQAAQVLRRAATLSQGDAAVRLDLEAAEQLLRGGLLDEGQAALQAILASIGEKTRRFGVAGVLRVLARRLWMQVRGFHFESRPQESIDPQKLLEMDALWTAGSALGYQQPFQGNDFCSRLCAVALEVGEPVRVARAVAAEAYSFSVMQGDLATDAWRRLIAVGRELGERLGDAFALALTLSAEAMGLYQRVDVRPVPALIDEAARLFREKCVGVQWELHITELTGLWALGMLGRYGEMGLRAERLAREARERGDLMAQINLDTGLPSMRWLVADRPELSLEARARLLERIAGAPGSPLLVWHMLVSEVMWAQYVGQPERALAACERASPVLQRSELAFVPIVQLELRWMHVSALLSTAAARGEPVPRRVAADLRFLRRHRMPLGVPLARAGEATTARLRGDHETAARALSAAATGFDELGYALYAAAARQQLGQILGGDEGAALCREATHLLDERAVQRPESFIRIFVPGTES